MKLDCGHEPSPHGEHTTGYGTDPVTGKTRCWECCAVVDRASMVEHGDSKRLPLYLHEGHVSNWPGSLKFKVWGVTKGRHNIARTRYDFRFHGPDGFVWRGTQYGEWTQVAHCRRTKERSEG